MRPCAESVRVLRTMKNWYTCSCSKPTCQFSTVIYNLPLGRLLFPPWYETNSAMLFHLGSYESNALVQRAQPAELEPWSLRSECGRSLLRSEVAAWHHRGESRRTGRGRNGQSKARNIHWIEGRAARQGYGSTVPTHSSLQVDSTGRGVPGNLAAITVRDPPPECP